MHCLNLQSPMLAEMCLWLPSLPILGCSLMADTCCQAVAAPLGHLPQCLCTAHPSVQNTSIGLSHSLSFSVNVISSDGHLPLVYTKQPIPILITSHVWGEVVSKQPMEQEMAVGEYLSTRVCSFLAWNHFYHMPVLSLRAGEISEV